MRPPDRVLAAALALQVEASARRVLPALRALGIEPIVLKGPALAAWLHPGQELRRAYGDLDLLVPPEELERAGTCLAALGYVRGQAGWDGLSCAWRLRGERIAIDLHRSLVGASADPEVVWRELHARSTELEALGREIRCLDEPGLAMHVATHAAQHGLDGAGKPLHDLRRALAIAGFATWAEAAELARRIDAEPALAAGLRRLPEGAAIAAELELGHDLPLDVRLRASPQPPPLVLGIEQLRRTSGAAARARFLASKLAPSAAQMRSTSRLAASGWLGLAAAYAARPIRLASGLPRALLRHRSLSREAKAARERPHHLDQQQLDQGDQR